MKTSNILKYNLIAILAIASVSCADLDQEPMSSISPNQYFNSDIQLATYTNSLYEGAFSTHGNFSYGSFGDDNHTDNMASKSHDNRYVPGNWRVEESGGDWDFNYIYKCNYFFEQAQPKLDAGLISGAKEDINQCFGEIYFFRAYEYFKKLQSIGDYPIVTTTLTNELGVLIESSKRSPRTEVAHFILSDLDKAISLLKEDPDGRGTRLSKKAALAFKSRVALHEGTWLKYFKDTPFVPNGPEWPGAKKEYNENYQFPEGSLDDEIVFFLSEAMEAAKQVADNISLVENNGILQQSETDPENPYLSMFGSVELTKYSEVILWREYSRALKLTHNVPISAQTGTNMIGLTRGYVDNFLMSNGLPIYDGGSGYAGDNYIADVKKNRDGRLWLFLKEPGQKNVVFNKSLARFGNVEEKYPSITTADTQTGYSTGYTLRKGISFDGRQLSDNGGCYTAAIVFRAAEVYLNYIEACYEKNNSLDSRAISYWKKIRERAKVDQDINKTIAATNMQNEAKNDWGAYSAGVIIDPTLYNIRRERRCELMAEGLRMMDLKRWRSLDQLITTPYHVEGFKLWGPMKSWYGNSLVYGTNDANVSAPTQSDYLRPLEINPNSVIIKNGGYRWAMAHYLVPIAINHMLITSEGSNSAENSVIYQNPYWPLRASVGATK